MDSQGVREAIHRQPFKPFEIRLADGRSLPVRHPDFVAIGQRRIVVIAEDDSSSIIEPILIVSLDYSGETGKRNGKARRKPRR